MRATNAMIELAEERVEMERQLGIADVRAATRRQRTYLDGAEILVCTNLRRDHPRGAPARRARHTPLHRLRHLRRAARQEFRLMDISIIGPWLAAANTALTLGVGVYAIMTRGSKDNAVALKRSNERLGEAERRIQALEAEMKHLPDAKDVTELKLAISEMRGSMNVQAAETSSVLRTVQRLEGYLLEKGK